MDRDVTQVLDEVVRRLAGRLGRPWDDPRVREAVERCSDGFRDARVETFIPILVERRAYDLLRHDQVLAAFE